MSEKNGENPLLSLPFNGILLINVDRMKGVKSYMGKKGANV
jgi:hypothetical protein